LTCMSTDLNDSRRRCMMIVAEGVQSLREH
jgi:hypothetical protein